MRALVFALTAAVLGCSASPAGSTDATPPTPSGPGGPAPSEAPRAPDDAAAPDAGADVEAGASSTYRNSLSVCWTDAKCQRRMIVAHGGDWSPTTVPYGSMGAVVAAYAHGVDAVKLDVRVTKDGVPVISH